MRNPVLASRPAEENRHAEKPPGTVPVFSPLANRSSLLGDLVGAEAPAPPPPKTRPVSERRPPGESRWWPFGYVQRGARDPRFDLLRGLCLIVMIVNNLGGNSWLYALTGAGTFYISAAEGFVFIAGYVLGLNAAREPLGETVRHLVGRAWVLYRLAVAITLIFGLLSTLGHLRLWYALPDYMTAAYAGQPDAFLVGTLTLAVAYHGAEFLILYILLFLVAPLALLACAEGKGWLVPLASVGLYLAVQLYPEQFHLPFATAVSFEAWQLLFFAGLAIGYHRPWLEELGATRAGYRRVYAAIIVAAALGLLVAYRQGLGPSWLFDRENIAALRAALTPRRLLLVAVYLQFFAFLATWFWGLLRSAFGWFLLSLGRNSLWVYVLHLPVIVLFRNVPYLAGLDRTTGTLAQILAVLALWGTIKLREWAGGSAYRAALPAPRPFRSLARR